MIEEPFYNKPAITVKTENSRLPVIRYNLAPDYLEIPWCNDYTRISQFQIG